MSIARSRRALVCALLIGALIPSLSVSAQRLGVGTSSSSGVGSARTAWTTPRASEDGEHETVRFFGYFLSRGEFTNVSNRVNLNQGQTVGRLFGPNSTETDSGSPALFFEQRFIPALVLDPKITAGGAMLRLSFEIDWTFGDTSNGVGGNAGGSLQGDQVNIQTQNVALQLRMADHWYAVLGLQPLTDNVRDAYETPFEVLSRTGTRLALWGSDATGLTLFGRVGEQQFKLGAYLLYENQTQRDDDVVVFQMLTDRHLGRTWHLGGGLHYLRDSSSGAGGLSALGQGPSSDLATYTGARQFMHLAGTDHATHVIWVVADLGYNVDYIDAPFSGSLFALGSLGKVRVQDGPDTALRGAAVSGRFGYRYGRTRHDVVELQSWYSTGDDGERPGTYTGVLTGNSWGAPGGLMSAPGSYLLTPHHHVVNRYYGALSDLSNMGFGTMLLSTRLAADLIPNRLNLRVGGASAFASVTPDLGDRFMGNEANLTLTFQARAFISVGLHAAYLYLGDFYKSPAVTENATRPTDPWTTFLTLTWLLT